MAILIVAVVCSVILATTGQRVQNEREVLASIDAAGTRLIMIADTSGGGGIDAAAIDRLAALGSTEWVFGLGPSDDGDNPALGGNGQRVSVRTLHGLVPPPLFTSWDPAQPTATAGPGALERLALRQPVGAVQLNNGRQAIIAGTFRPQAPLESLNATVLVSPLAEGATDEVRTIYLMAKHPDDVARLVTAARQVLGAADGSQIGIDTSDALISARAAVSSDLGRQARQAALLILSVGLVLSGINVLGMVILRQKDFGRRRVLGATRASVIMLVALQTGLLATLGAAVGCLVGSVLVWNWTEALPAFSFATAVGILAVISSTMAALPPATLAARRDPVRALRVP